MNKQKSLPIICSIVLIIFAFIIIMVLIPEPVEAQQEVAIKQPVTISLVQPSTYRPSIHLLGTTQARWPVALKAQSSAKLSRLSHNAEVGTLVKQGETLMQLDTTHLKSQLAQALSTLRQAELNLQKEQHEQTVALQMLPTKDSSAYARREPQIASAKALLAQAQEAYKSAQRYLDDARITAPFDAVVLTRPVSPGQQVAEGEELITLAASDSLDVFLPIAEQDWQTITAVLPALSIEVTDRQGQHWPASLRYVAPQADANSHQRQVVLAVSKPYQQPVPRLLPNQQVSVDVKLAQHDHVAQIPLSALTRDGEVWTVDEKKH